MGRTKTEEKKKADSGKTRQRRDSIFPWKQIFVAAVPIALSVYYLAWVAPALVPLPAGVSVPYPEATRWLEPACVWAGNHQLQVALLGLGLLASGALVRFSLTADHYYLVLAVTVSLALGFTYMAISAPIDRLINAVEAAIPSDERVPDPAARAGR